MGIETWILGKQTLHGVCKIEVGGGDVRTTGLLRKHTKGRAGLTSSPLRHMQG
jgi:hypothetical protein